MKNLLRKIILIIAVLAGLLANPNFARAEALSLNNIAVTPKNLGDAIEQTIKTKIKSGTYFILGIESKIQSSKEELSLLRGNIDALKGRIEESNVKIGNLQSQLENMDRLIIKNKEKIQAVRIQIVQHEKDIDGMELSIKQKEKDLTSQIAALDSAMSAFYMQNNVFFDQQMSPNLLAFLAVKESTGEILRENEYLFAFQYASQQLAKLIIETRANLDQQKDFLILKQQKLAKLRELLEKESNTLFEAQQSRVRLLNQTKGQQLIYETLLELSKREERQVAMQINRLKENYEFFQEKLEQLKNDPSAVNINAEAWTETDEEEIFRGDTVFAWPVSPALGISAYFHDEAYRRALGIPHNAIDIRIPQESRVHAAADGVVTKTVDSGFGYSYIILAHTDKMITLYGHISDILVQEGEIVRQGQVIGFSGGIPGTKGAGWLTTGAHLHFEVFKDWQHVDPLEYLPLELAPLEALPEKYIEKVLK